MKYPHRRLGGAGRGVKDSLQRQDGCVWQEAFGNPRALQTPQRERWGHVLLLFPHLLPL